MDNEAKKLLEETYELSKENNKMLRKIRGLQKRQAILQIIHWVIVIGIAIGALYFLEPYIAQIKDFAKNAGATFEALRNLMPN